MIHWREVSVKPLLGFTCLESIRIHQNQNKMVKWTSRYCPILKLLKAVEDFAFHKHNYHSVHPQFRLFLRPTLPSGTM